MANAMVPVPAKLPLSKETWQKIRHGREVEGWSFSELAKRFGVSHQAICRKANIENWANGRDLVDAVRARANEKAAEVTPEMTDIQREQIIEEEAEKAAGVIRRHRAETAALREMAYNGINQSREARTIAEKRLLELDTRIQNNLGKQLNRVQEMERRAWNLDAPSENQQIVQVQVEYVQQ